jgi:hypothetical protein
MPTGLRQFLARARAGTRRGRRSSHRDLRACPGGHQRCRPARRGGRPPQRRDDRQLPAGAQSRKPDQRRLGRHPTSAARRARLSAAAASRLPSRVDRIGPGYVRMAGHAGRAPCPPRKSSAVARDVTVRRSGPDLNSHGSGLWKPAYLKLRKSCPRTYRQVRGISRCVRGPTRTLRT